MPCKFRNYSWHTASGCPSLGATLLLGFQDAAALDFSAFINYQATEEIFAVQEA